MSYWFECKVTYERNADAVGLKKVSEIYLVNALSFTEAEERIIAEISPLVSMGELEVTNIKRVKFAELFLAERESADRFFKARVNFITVDEKSGTEKRAGVNMLVQSESLPDALGELVKQMEGQLGEYEISSIADSPILDVIKYEPKS